ncbi:hypothetical protein [Peribacillus sp. FSL P2-0133]|uniref:hypothetical protein n=1 Tax=Peribacillus sp. FSL P2-0133 TaxID=2921573 RepID=UPI0030CF7F14
MFFTVILNGLKKFATLLPNNWLAETPETLASRRLGRQSAERERISEINSNEPWLRQGYPSCFFTVILNGLKKFQPNNWLAKTPKALALMRLGRQSAERERISEVNSNVFICPQP